MPISTSAGASDSEEHLVAVQGRLFEHSHFWIEELVVSEFVCLLLPTLGTLVSSQHIAAAFSQECR